MKKSENIKTTKEQPFNVNEFFGQDSIEKASELFKQLQTTFLNGKDLDIDLRLLGHWVKILYSEKESSGRTKYSFTDYVFLKIVEQLRNTGLSFPILTVFKSNILEEIKLKGLVTKIQQAKSYIEDLKISKEQKDELRKLLASPDANNLNDETAFTMLHIIIMECLLKKQPLSLAVFLDGTYIILDRSKEHLYSEDDKNRLLFDTYSVISVSTILKKFLYSDLSGFVIPQIGLLSYSENKLFEVVHSGEYDSILIHFKDKKIKSMELKKSEDIKQRIIDILEKDTFGEIVVKKHKGVVTKIENTIKMTL